MTALDHDLRPDPASGESWADRLPGAFRAAVAWGSAARARREAKHLLRHLDDHILKDIGLGGGEPPTAWRRDHRRRPRFSLLPLGLLLNRVL